MDDEQLNKLLDRVLIYQRNMIVDERGWFLKVINGKELNLPKNEYEIYVISAEKGQTRGGHYHVLANEWFTLLKGNVSLLLEDIHSLEKITIHLNANIPQTIYVPNNIAHKFVNESDESFMVCAFTDRYYDVTDTIPYEL